jgi:hypothetical protein
LAVEDTVRVAQSEGANANMTSIIRGQSKDDNRQNGSEMVTENVIEPGKAEKIYTNTIDLPANFIEGFVPTRLVELWEVSSIRMDQGVEDDKTAVLVNENATLIDNPGAVVSVPIALPWQFDKSKVPADPNCSEICGCQVSTCGWSWWSGRGGEWEVVCSVCLSN